MSDIYNAWTKASEIEKWFLSKAIYFDTNKHSIKRDANVTRGSTYKWHWYLSDPYELGKITEANGKDLVQFTFADNCLVEIKLTTQDDQTIVELTQKNIPTDDNSKQNIRLECDFKWSFFLVNLKSVYEGGPNLRNKNSNFKGMLNN